MTFRKDIAMFATLVTAVGDMELKCKIIQNAKIYFEPQEAFILLPHEAAILLPHDAAILLPQEEATLLPQEAENELPDVIFITPCAVVGDV